MLRQLPASRTSFTLMEGVRRYTEATILGAYAALGYRRPVRILDCIEYADGLPMVMLRFLLLPAQTANGHVPPVARDLDQAVQAELRQRVSRGSLRQLPAWQLLGCPPHWSAAKKAVEVRKARQGLRPDFLSPAQWATSPLNSRSKFFADALS